MYTDCIKNVYGSNSVLYNKFKSVIFAVFMFCEVLESLELIEAKGFQLFLKHS